MVMTGSFSLYDSDSKHTDSTTKEGLHKKHIKIQESVSLHTFIQSLEGA